MKKVNHSSEKKFFILQDIKTKKKKLKWGKIISKHGNNGIFLAKFKKNLCPYFISSLVYVTHLPNSI